MTKHTPGPWNALKYPDVKSWTVAAGKSVASKIETEANARLIAAAPLLLDTLEYVSMNMGCGEGQINPRLVELQKLIKSAIAKATGGEE